MNEKAKKFSQYLKEKEIKAFTTEELKDDLHTVVFRSRMDIQGNSLPTIVVWDDSIYGMIRILVAPKALNETNKTALLELLNGYNKKYKSFKYYVDDEGSLLLDACLLTKTNEADGDMVYIMFDVFIQHLNEVYKEIMKVIWQ